MSLTIDDPVNDMASGFRLLRGEIMLLVGAGVMAAPLTFGATLHVHPSGSNAGNNDCLASPCKTITYALSKASGGSPGDTILVAPGTYSNQSGEVFPLNLVSGVSLKSVAGVYFTLITKGGAGIPRLFNLSGNNAFTLLEGFSLRSTHDANFMGGSAQGGSILITGGDQTVIRRNLFLDNVAAGFGGTTSSPNAGDAYGGSIYVSGASPLIQSNVFRDNEVRGGQGGIGSFSSPGGNGGNAYGAAIYVESGGGTIANNTFYSNSARGGQGRGLRGSGRRWRRGSLRRGLFQWRERREQYFSLQLRDGRDSRFRNPLRGSRRDFPWRPGLRECTW